VEESQEHRHKSRVKISGERMMKNRAKLVRGGQQRRDNMLGSVVKEKMQRTEREKKSLLISYIFCWGLVRSGAH